MKLTKHKINSFFKYSFTIFILFILDFLTKNWAQKKFLISQSATDIRDYTSTSMHLFSLGGGPNWFDMSLTYVRNTGAAWGLLSNMTESIRPYFFTIVTIIAIALIITFFVQTPKYKTLARTGMLLILAGAFGNFFDRFFFHYVIDWIHVRWTLFSWYYDFPVFNLADSCVTVGVTLLLIDMFVSERKKRKHHGTATVSKKLNE